MGCVLVLGSLIRSSFIIGLFIVLFLGGWYYVLFWIDFDFI